MIFEGIEPQVVLNYFEDICSIPRPSYDEKKISDYLVDFAKQRGLEVFQDSSYNVVIKKPASLNRENDASIILQAHIDMVTAKDEGVEVDFHKDGVIPYVDGDLIKAKGTTLGGDDGIGMAMILAILDSDDISHPMIEAVFTVSEEVGLDGAANLDYSLLQSKKMINIDSEEDYQMTVGCAGGCRADITFNYKKKKEKGLIYELIIDGLNGGHSGIEIDKGNANANVLMGRVLSRVSDNMNISLISCAGGDKDNAICPMCKAYVLINRKDEEKFIKNIEKVKDEIKGEYSVVEKNFDILLQKQKQKKAKVLCYEDFLRVIILLTVMPDGVQKMSQHIPGLVETSLNIGVLKIEDGLVESGYAIRSNIESGLDWLVDRVTTLAKSLGANISIHGRYPAWENQGISNFAKEIVEKYKYLYNEELSVVTIHAGLECGLFYQKIPNLEAVSIGPNLYGAHTTKESVSISSIQKEWRFLLEILNS